MVTVEHDTPMAARIVAASGAGIIVTDPQTRIVLVNPAFTRITGYTSQEVVGRNPRLLHSGQQSARFYHRMWRRLAEQKQWRGELWNRRKTGEVYPELLCVTAIEDRQGRLLQYVGVFEEITAQKRHEERLRRLAFFDPLTGLPNRLLLADRIERGLALSRRSATCLAVLFIDLDGFKRVNDEFGHAVGDRVLELIGRALVLGLRQSDTVARVGGDEFVVLLPSLESPREVIPIARKILRSLRAGVTVHGHQLRVSASIGISSFPHDGRDGPKLIRLADAAMYALKRSGKSGFRFYPVGVETGIAAPGCGAVGANPPVDH